MKLKIEFYLLELMMSAVRTATEKSKKLGQS